MEIEWYPRKCLTQMVMFYKIRQRRDPKRQSRPLRLRIVIL
ncbi:unnamed protein product [Brassica oleracea var. botrytis]